MAVCGAFCFWGCANGPEYSDTLDDTVASATLAGWRGAGLPEPGEHCYVARFRIEHAADRAEFEQLCWVPPERARSCFLWRLETHPAMELFSRVYPAAVLRPNVPPELVSLLGVHELLHGLVDCALKRPNEDPYDAGHTDTRVWGAGSTAEGRAQERLATP
jgi:hypothetical protein